MARKENFKRPQKAYLPEGYCPKGTKADRHDTTFRYPHGWNVDRDQILSHAMQKCGPSTSSGVGMTTLIKIARDSQHFSTPKPKHVGQKQGDTTAAVVRK